MNPADREARRHFLLRSAALLISPVAFANDEYEAFRRQYQQQMERFRSRDESAYAQYQAEMEAAFAAYSESYRAATRGYRQALSAHWRDPQISDQRRWVEYSDDQAVQRIVDFERNTIELRIRPQVRQQPQQQLVIDALQQLLSENTATAVARDPVTQQVEQAVQRSAPSAVAQAKLPTTLVLGELFDNRQPSQQQLQQKVVELAANATSQQDVESGVVTLTVPLPADRPLRKAQHYLPIVERHATKWKIEPALVLAVMHTESAFNPLARSAAPAYGLMQIVPTSAGKDATQLVFGKARVVAPSYLYDPEKNVQLGCAYLHILLYRYLRQIDHPEARLYCSIAAYNTGAGNVARSYTGKTSIVQAAKRINQQSPQQVYHHLVKQLPHQETRDYLQRVSRRLATYRAM